MTAFVCVRCGQNSNCSTMSFFNTDLICCDCKEVERKHPAFAAAYAAEDAAVRAGNHYFPGVGAPPDLIEFTLKERGLK